MDFLKEVESRRKREYLNLDKMLCSNDTQEARIYSSLNLGVQSFGTICMLCALITYGLLRRKLSLDGWSKSAFSLFMFLNFVSTSVAFAIDRFGGQWKFNQIHAIITVNGVLDQFFWVSSYSWVTILNFNAWLMLRSSLPIKNFIRRKTLFLIYCIVGLAVSTLAVVISLVIEISLKTPNEEVTGRNSDRLICSKAKSVTSVPLLCVCLVLFTVALSFGYLNLKLQKKIRLELEILKLSARNHWQTRVDCLSKLFFLMGISWLCKLTFHIVARKEVNVPSSLYWPLLVLSTYDAICALGIVWIFICNEEIKSLLFKNYEVLQDVYNWRNRLSQRFSGKSTAVIQTSQMEVQQI